MREKPCIEGLLGAEERRQEGWAGELLDQHDAKSAQVFEGLWSLVNSIVKS